MKISREKLRQMVEEETKKVLYEYASGGDCPKGWHKPKRNGPCELLISAGYAVIPAAAAAQVAARYAATIKSREGLGVALVVLARKIERWLYDNDKVETKPADPISKTKPAPDKIPMPLSPDDLTDLYKDLGIETIMNIRTNPDEDEEEKPESSRDWYFFPGGFKPPHVGHHSLASMFFSTNILEGLGQGIERAPRKIKRRILIGNKPREGHDQTQSKTIWDHYIQNTPILAGKEVEAMATPASPIKWLFDALGTGFGTKPQIDPTFIDVDKYGPVSTPVIIRPGDRMLVVVGPGRPPGQIAMMRRLAQAARAKDVSFHWIGPGDLIKNSGDSWLLRLNGWRHATQLRTLIRTYLVNPNPHTKLKILDFIPKAGTIDGDIVFDMMTRVGALQEVKRKISLRVDRTKSKKVVLNSSNFMLQ